MSPSPLDPLRIAQVGTTLWRRLFDQFGWPPSLRRGQLLDELVLERALADDALPDLLTATLQHLEDLGTDEGRDHLLACGGDSLRDLADRALAPMAFVAQACLASAADPRVRDAITRAQVQALVARAPERRLEFATKAHLSFGGAELERWRTALKEWLRDRGLAHAAGVLVEDALRRYVAVYERRMVAPHVLESGARKPLPHRPLRAAVFHCDAATGILTVRANSHDARELVRAFGAGFAGSPEAFAPTTASLSALKKGRGILVPTSPEVEAVRVTSVTWRADQGGRLELTADDVFSVIERLGLPIEQGDFLRARLSFRFATGSPRTTTAYLEAPNSLRGVDSRRGDLIARTLADMGLWRADEHAEQRSWLGTWSAEEWRRGHGDQANEARSKGILRPAARFVVPASPAASVPQLEVHRVDGAEPPFHGIDPSGHAPSRPLSSTEIEGLQLVPERYASFLASALSLEGPVQQLQEGCFDLGHRVLGDRDVRVVLALQPAPRLRPRPGEAVHLVPPGITPADAPAFVTIPELLPPARILLRSIATKIGAQGLDARLMAPPNARLILDVACQAAWFDEIPVSFTERPWKFVLALARASAANHALSSSEIADVVGGRRGSRDSSRRARLDAMDAIAGACVAAGRPRPDNLFPSAGPGRGYRFAGLIWATAVPES